MAAVTGKRSCPNEVCNLHGQFGQGNIRTHGWYKTKHGKRRRYRCSACGKTFASTKGSAYLLRPHMALKFGNQIWTPAMMAGIAKRKLTWRDVLEGRITGLLLVIIWLNIYPETKLKTAA